MLFVGYDWAEVPAPEYDGEYQLMPEYEWHGVEKYFESFSDAANYTLRVLDRLRIRAGEVIMDSIGIYDEHGTALWCHDFE